ncbi:MAG: DUF3494 domain-containing protein [Verrucomicrobiales bacterium]|nr:DUF3494 domain-containing protein [Verrucomicrobiales bacterium]MCP5559982.1 DUF3494 domain-containing protein [Verrucomicrobiaceae bacterium]
MKLPYLLSVLLATIPLLASSVCAQSVDLGTATSFAVVGGSGITNTGATTVTGDVGSFPTISQTGFGPGANSVTLNGTNFGGNAVTQQAKNDMVTAYNDAFGRSANVVFAPAFDLGGSTLVAGVYNDPSSFAITGVLTLDAQGNPNAVWIFQTGSTLVTASNSSIILVNGADGCNVFWQVGTSATLGANTVFIGTILANTSITANTGATVTGRLLALNGAVTMDTNTIAAAICKELIRTSTSDVKPKVEDLKAALILAAMTVDVSTLPGLTSIYTQGFAQFDTEVFTMQQRFADLRANQPFRTGRPSSAAPDAYTPSTSEKNPVSGKNPWGGKNPLSAKAGKVGLSVQPDPVQLEEDNRYGFFITATGNSTIAGDANNYDGSSIGTSIGMDVRLSDSFVAGVTIGYSHSRADLVGDGKVETDGGKAALYGMYQHGNFYTEGLVGGGYNSYDIERSAFLGMARGKTEGGQFDSYLGVGYDMTVGDWTITPMASLLYTIVGINGYDEIGSLVPLKIESQSANSLRSRIGPRIAHTSHWGDTRITPSVSAQWQHEFLDEELPFDARFANNPRRRFTVNGPKIGRDSVLVTAGLNIAWKSYAVYLAYQADLGRENYESQSALVGFRMSW